MRNLLTIHTALIPVLLACAAIAPRPAQAEAATDPAPTSPEARFRAISSSEWTWRLEQDGHAPGDTPETPQKFLPDVSPAAQAARLTRWQEVRRQIAAISPDSLPAGSRVDYAVYTGQIDALIADQTCRAYEMPANSDTAFWTGIEGDTDFHPKNEAEYRSYLTRLSQVGRYFHDQTDNMRAGLAHGLTPPRVTLQGRDASIAAYLGKPPAETAFYAPFLDMPATIPAATQAALRKEALATIRETVIPAYQTLLTFFRNEYFPHTRTTLSAETLPDGKACYQAAIREYTTTDLTPDQIHKTGLEEIAKIRAEMQQTMKASGFTGDMPAFLAWLRKAPQFYAKTPDELLKDAAWIAKQVDGRIGRYIGHLPRQRFGIVPVPANIAPFYTAARGGAGVYLVNTWDLPARPLYALRALTLHESAPGHAFQLPLAAENKDQPDFRRYSYLSAYGEGWALYCERLGDEMGLYETPYDRFGMLSYQAWRAARLVVDTGIHHMGWTRDQAIRYLLDNTALSRHEVETEVDRYISWPGQALSYYLGEMAIRQARAKAEAALGPAFNIRAFHDVVLQTGSVPLPELTTRVDQFIHDGGKGPYPDEE
ncbi:DUF885 family protein [Acetobacter musti]|uniref:DUF885 family protein n=1 Tax=Acetobacter musti TaxID=864732 RepID=A0ABX0JSS2_9PROT|nr:DUF885 family protein [Acetobacter musti]NHN85857.1 DUF885 family protein [Acetobacter musti]